MKICPNCNFENENEAQFCVECGNNIKNVKENQNNFWDFFELKFWEKVKTHFYCDNYILKWSYQSKKYFFFEKTNEFYFPIRQISSIRYHSGTNENLFKIILCLAFLIAWIVFILPTQWWSLISFMIWIFIFILMKTKNIKIIFNTSGKDSQVIAFSTFEKWKQLKKLVEFINQKILENNKK